MTVHLERCFFLARDHLGTKVRVKEVRETGKEREKHCPFVYFTLGGVLIYRTAFSGPQITNKQNEPEGKGYPWLGQCLKQASHGARALQVNTFGKNVLPWLAWTVH